METDELITGQYADRPRLRPVLDAVLAAVPGLGPVRVEPRTTCVSLFSPARLFASVQPTTKNRVDLGLRLTDAKPGGRLQVAKGVGSGSINLRIGLTEPGEVDAEVRGWLRQAYTDSIAPPPPRRPARRPGPTVGTMTVVISGTDLPGLNCNPAPDARHDSVHVALSGNVKDRPSLVIPGSTGLALEPYPGDAASVRWEVPVKVRRNADGYDFGGPFVRGARDDRNLGLAWGDAPGDGTLRLFRGAKLRLVDVDRNLIEDALRPGRRLVARLHLTDARGNPVCARLRPPYIEWAVEPG